LLQSALVPGHPDVESVNSISSLHSHISFLGYG
jgi:hypothetical protein